MDAVDAFFLLRDYYQRGLSHEVVIEDASVKVGDRHSFPKGTPCFRTKNNKVYPVESVAFIIKEYQGVGGQCMALRDPCLA